MAKIARSASMGCENFVFSYELYKTHYLDVYLTAIANKQVLQLSYTTVLYTIYVALQSVCEKARDLHDSSVRLLPELLTKLDRGSRYLSVHLPMPIKAARRMTIP